MAHSIAIIGGGPVGLYLAIYLSKNGADITVYEKNDWPVDKVCGQGIMPSGVSLLRDIGLKLELLPSYKFSSIEYIDHDLYLKGFIRRDSFGVKRSELSEALYLMAKQRSNIQLCPNTNIQNIIEKNNKYAIAINEEIKNYDYIFGCDGLNSITRHLINSDKKRIFNKNRFGARVHYEVEPWCDSVQVYWEKGVEAYVTPISKTKVEVAFLWFDHFVKKEAKLESRLLSLFPELQAKLSHGETLNDFKGYGPFNKVAKQVKKKNIFLVGDAYKFLDGITGEGISTGLKSARIIANNYHHFTIWDQLKIKALYLNYFIWVSLALLLSKYPSLRRFVFRGLSRNKRLFEIVLRLNDIGEVREDRGFSHHYKKSV